MTDGAPPQPAPAARDSIGDLLRRLVDDMILLVRSELRLAGGEIRQKAAGAAGSVGAIVAGATLLSLATLCLVGAAVAWLAERVGLVPAALIVAAATAGVGALLIIVGIGRLRTTDLAPQRAVANLKRSVGTLTGAETLKGD